MWQLDNRTPFAAERCFVRDTRGSEVWLVAVKASFHFTLDGTTHLLEQPPEFSLKPRYVGEPGRSSLQCEVDLVHNKAATDVLLHGHAHAPRGRPAPQVDVMLKVGSQTKAVRVYGDRTWHQRQLGQPQLSAPEPFVRIPLLYERAFGGTDPSAAARGEQGATERRNPVGMGLALSAEDIDARPVPNLEYPHAPITSWTDKPPPAGFGPIDRSWSPRVELAGTYDSHWEEERAPLLPLDFDVRFHQCAPQDQQVPGHLKGGEPVTLRHLTPERDEVTFALPRHWFGFLTFFGRETVEHRAELQTVLIEPDVFRLTMTWGTSLPCQNKEHKLERTRIWQKELL